MTVRTVEVEPAAAVVVIDFAATPLAGVGPVLKPALSNAGEDRIEVVFVDQESVVLKRNVSFDLVKIERRPVVECHDRKGPKRVGAAKPRISARNVAERCWSRHQTMVWLNRMLMLRSPSSISFNRCNISLSSLKLEEAP